MSTRTDRAATDSTCAPGRDGKRPASGLVRSGTRPTTAASAEDTREMTAAGLTPAVLLPGWRIAPTWGRAADVAEVLVTLAVVPLAVWSAGLVGIGSSGTCRADQAPGRGSARRWKQPDQDPAGR